MSDTLTMETLDDILRTMKSLGPPAQPPWRYGLPGYLGGMPVIESNYLPQERVLIGHWIYPVHPIVRWLAKRFHFSPWAVQEMFEMRPKAYAYLFQSMLLTSPLHAAAIRVSDCTA